MIELKVYITENNRTRETYSTTDTGEIYKRLAETLIAKKINGCNWVKSIKRVNLFNGYQKITVSQTNNIKEIYIIKN